MKLRRGVKTCFMLIILLFISVGWAFSGEATVTTVIGEVNDNYQIVSDDQIYEIADTKKGQELVGNFIGARVEVTGTVEEDNDIKIITITSFKVLTD